MFEFGEKEDRSSMAKDALATGVQAQIEEGLERSGLFFYVIDREYRFRYISAAAASSLGQHPDEVIGRTPKEVGIPAEVSENIEAVVNETLKAGTATRGTIISNARFTEIFEYDATPVYDGGSEPTAILAVVYDRSAQALERKALEAIGRVNDFVRSSLDRDELVKRTVDAVSGSLNDDALALVIDNGGEWTVSHSVKLPADEEKELSEEAIRFASQFIDRAGPEAIADAMQDPRVSRKAQARFGGRSMLVIPVRISPAASIVLTFVRMNVRPFTQHEIDLGEKIASSVSVAVKDQLMLQDLTTGDRQREGMLVCLARESEKLTTILDATPVAIALFEDDGKDFRLMLSNSIFRSRILNSAPRPMEGTYISELVVPEELARGRALVREAFATGRTKVSQDYIHHTGEVSFPSQVMFTPISRDPDSFLMVAVNISELVNARKQSEENAVKVEAERARLRAMIDNLPVGVVLVDAAGKVLEANDKRAEIWGGRVTRDRTLDAIHNVRAKWSNNGMPVAKDGWPIHRALKNGEYVKGEMVDIVRPDGRHGTELLSAAPINDAKGVRIGAVGILQDVTEQRQLEHEALEAKERAEMYLDLVTHDIQGHNAAISGYIQLALAKDKQGKRKDELQKALDSIRASTDLIDTMHKIQMVEMHDTAHGHTELASMLDEVISDVLVVGGKRTHIEKITTPDSFAMASPMIREAFWNILINSVKHSEGDIHIVVRQNRSYDGGREYHKFIIEDDGPGIADDIKPKVFLRKYRGRTKAQGSGLGLYLTKRLVEEHGGRIWVEDRVSGDHTKGVRFIVHLPAVAMPNENISRDGGEQ